MPRHPLAVIAAALALAGCHQTRKPEIPAVVRVPVETPVPLPESLTQPCTAARAGSRTVDAVVSAYNANRAALADCDRRMGEIRRLQESAKP